MNIDAVVLQQQMILEAQKRLQVLEAGRDAAMADMVSVGYSYAQLAVALDLDIAYVEERVEMVRDRWRGRPTRSQRRRAD